MKRYLLIEKMADAIYRKTSLLFFIVLPFSFFCNVASAATITSSRNGNWNNPTTWSGGVIPSSADNVIITSNHNVTVNGLYNCSSLVIGPTNNNIATLTFNSGSQLTVTGIVTLGNSGNNNRRGSIIMTSGGILSCQGFALANSGSNSFTPGSGTVILTATNTIPATRFTSFNNLSISSGTTTFSAVTNVSNLLSFNSGVMANLGGFNHNAGILTLGGAGPLLLTWGSTSSGAANTSNTYFTGTGRITITNSAPYPAIDNNFAFYSNGVTGQVAGTRGEYDGLLTLTAPPGSTFINTKFASYGTPGGTSPDFTIGSCHAFNSRIVTTGLLGNNTATIPASGAYNDTFGDPCFNIVKTYNVVATYAEPFCTTTPVGSIFIDGSTPTGGNGSYTYFWEVSTTGHSSGFSAAPGTNNAEDYTVLSGTSATTWYRRTVNSGIYSDITIVIVQVVTVPPTAPTTISGTTSICNSTTLTVSGGSKGGPGGYTQWTSGSCTGAVIGTGDSITVSPTANTTYFASYKNSCGTSTCASRAITNSISITAAASASAVCASASAQTTPLTYSATTGTPTTYSIVWNTSPANTFVAVTDAALTAGSISIAVPANTVAGTYTGTLTVKNAGGCISFANVFTVTVKPLPNNTGTSGFTGGSFCLGNQASISFDALDSNGFPPYTLSYTGGGNTYSQIISSNAPTLFNVAATSSTTYTLNSITDNNNGCVNTNPDNKTANVTFRPNPTATISGTTSVCVGATNPTLTFTNPQTAGVTITYKINGGPDQTISVPASTTNTVTVPTATAGSFVYALTTIIYSTAPSCSQSVSGSATVTVNALPSTPAISSFSNINCTNATGSISLSGLPASGTLNQSGAAANSYAITGTTMSITGLAAGGYSFTVTNNGCTSNSSASQTISNDSSTTWNGTSWSNSTPTQDKAAVINGNLTISTNLAACSLTVNSGTVTVNSGFTLTITNAITVAGGQLIFNNNASLIQTTNAVNSGSIQYKRTSSLMKNFDYTYWSSPVTGQTAKALSPNTLADKYFKFDGAANNWVFDDGVMIPGRGYIIRVPKPGNWPLPNAEVVTDPYSQPVTFIGVPNNGDKTFAVGANQFNLIGNPYPSAINADDFITENISIISGALYFWTHSTPITQSGSKYVYSSNDYATYNISGGVKTFGNFNAPEWVDLNNNKTIDPGEWTDKNGNGIIDTGEWVDNNDKMLQTNEWNDVNNNGIAETGEWKDANNNNIFETGEWIDSNADGVFQKGEWTDDNNGIFETGDWIDSNADKILNLGVEVAANKPSGKIAAGQSFFVGNTNAGDFKFTNAMRVAGEGDNTQFFKFSKTATIERNRIWLNLTNTDGAFKQLLIGYLTGATNNLDNLFDGSTFDGNAYIDFYSINNTNKLTIQGRALPFEITDSVPLGYRSTIEGPFEIAIDQTDGLLSSKEILLEDKKTGTTHNLTQEKYSFTAIKGVENDRFVLKYANKVLSVKEEIKDNKVSVYVKDKKINIKSTLIPIEKIVVYDVSGRKIYEKESIGLNEYILENFANNKQFLIVKTILKDETVTTEKVIF